MPRSNRSATDPGERFRCERGSGLLSSALGVAIVAALVGLVANVALGLWIRTTVDAVAYDTARRVATSDPAADSDASVALIEREAIAEARQLLGPYGNRVSMEFIPTVDPSVVALRVRAPGVTVLPRMFARSPTVGGMDRTILVHREGSR